MKPLDNSREPQTVEIMRPKRASLWTRRPSSWWDGFLKFHNLRFSNFRPTVAGSPLELSLNVGQIFGQINIESLNLRPFLTNKIWAPRIGSEPVVKLLVDQLVNVLMKPLSQYWPPERGSIAIQWIAKRIWEFECEFEPNFRERP